MNASEDGHSPSPPSAPSRVSTPVFVWIGLLVLLVFVSTLLILRRERRRLLKRAGSRRRWHDERTAPPTPPTPCAPSAPSVPHTVAVIDALHSNELALHAPANSLLPLPRESSPAGGGFHVPLPIHLAHLHADIREADERAMGVHDICLSTERTIFDKARADAEASARNRAAALKARMLGQHQVFALGTAKSSLSASSSSSGASHGRPHTISTASSGSRRAPKLPYPASAAQLAATAGSGGGGGALQRLGDMSRGFSDMIAQWSGRGANNEAPPPETPPLPLPPPPPPAASSAQVLVSHARSKRAVADELEAGILSA